MKQSCNYCKKINEFEELSLYIYTYVEDIQTNSLLFGSNYMRYDDISFDCLECEKRNKFIETETENINREKLIIIEAPDCENFSF